jgi:hypothetical protein
MMCSAEQVCNPEQAAQGMSMLYSTWGLALILGPAASGLLAHPEQWAAPLFADGAPLAALGQQRPYFLPSMVSALLALCGLLASALALKETGGGAAAGCGGPGYTSVPSADVDDGDGDGDDDADVDRGGSVDAAVIGRPARVAASEARGCRSWCCACTRRQAGPWDWGPSALNVLLVIALDMLRGFYVIADDNLFPLWAAAPHSAGGLSYEPEDTGIILSLTGCFVSECYHAQVHSICRGRARGCCMRHAQPRTKNVDRREISVKSYHDR